MTPCSYIETSPGVYEFHYSFAQLRGFIKKFKNTDRGDLLIVRVDNNTNRVVHKGYPSYSGVKFSYDMARVPELDDGPGFLDPDLIINPPTPKEYEWEILLPTGKFNRR